MIHVEVLKAADGQDRLHILAEHNGSRVTLTVTLTKQDVKELYTQVKRLVK